MLQELTCHWCLLGRTRLEPRISRPTRSAPKLVGTQSVSTNYTACCHLHGAGQRRGRWYPRMRMTTCFTSNQSQKQVIRSLFLKSRWTRPMKCDENWGYQLWMTGWTIRAISLQGHGPGGDG